MALTRASPVNLLYFKNIFSEAYLITKMVNRLLPCFVEESSVYDELIIMSQFYYLSADLGKENVFQIFERKMDQKRNKLRESGKYFSLRYIHT